MRLLLIFITFIMATANCFAQSYEELIEKSYDFLDKKDLVSAEESLRAAMRLEPGNPMNYALLTNLGSIQRRQGKLQDALLSYTGRTQRTSQQSDYPGEPRLSLLRAGRNGESAE